MDRSTLIFFQTLMLLTNIIEMVFLLTFFFGGILDDDFYIYVNVFQVGAGALVVAIMTFLAMESNERFNWRVFIPFITHIAYHLVSFIIVFNTITFNRSTAVSGMITKSMVAIAVFITYMRGE